MTTRGVFKLSSYRSQELVGDGVPIDDVWTLDKLQQKGYTIGGENSSNQATSNYNQLNYDTDTRTNAANSPLATMGASGTASPSTGYTYGGKPTGSSPNYYSSVSKFDFNTQTHTALPGTNYNEGNIGNGKFQGASCGSQTHGYLCGGRGPGEGGGYSRMDRMAYATETLERLPSSNMPGPNGQEYNNSASGDGNTAGYWVGGANGAGSNVRKYTYSQESWSSLPNLPGANPLNRSQKAGQASSDTGTYVVGGSNPYSTRIQKITFATGNSAIVANSSIPTSLGRFRLTGTGNVSTGYFCGGSETSVVEKMNFSTDSTSRIPAMDLAQGVRDLGSCSSTEDNRVAPESKRWVDSNEQEGYGVEFDGSEDWLEAADSDDYSFGSGDYTIEFWVNPEGTINDKGYVCKWKTNGNLEWFVGTNSSTLVFAYTTSGSGYTIPSSGYTMQSGVWQHIAVTREGGYIKIFVDGVQRGSTHNDSSANYFNGPDPLVIMANEHGGSSWRADGKISNLRIVKGQALYTSNFTPTTESLTDTSQGATASNVKLICCNSSSVTGSTKTSSAISVGGGSPNLIAQTIVTPRPPTVTLTKQTVDQYSPSLSNNGYWLGGKENPGPSGNRAAKINFATDTASGLPNVPLRAQFQGGMSSSTHGYSVAGYDEVPDGAARYKSNVYKVQYSTDSYSWQGTYPAGKINGMVGVSAGTDHGYGAGGFDTGGSSSNAGGRSSIHKFTFATHTWATIPDKLAQDNLPNTPTPTPKRGSSGGNREYGYFVAMDSASYPGRWGQMTKIAYSTDTTYGSLPKFTHNGAGGDQGLSDTSTSSSKTAMYTLGNWVEGGSSRHSSQFEKWTFSTDTMALLPSSTPGLVSSSSNTASGNWEAGYHNGAENSKKIVYATETTTQNPSTAFTSSNIPASPRVYSEGVAVSARNSDGGKETVPVVC